MIPYIQNKPVNVERVTELLDICKTRNHYTNAGPVKALLEAKLAQLMNLSKGKRVLAVSNGTTALHALVAYYNKKAGKTLKWITPSFTFPSCIANNTNTVIVDIDPVTNTLSPDDVGDADGIIITNLFGTIMDFDISKFKDKIIIYDNASSFLSTDSDGTNMCEMGHASFGSLHHTKVLGFGEGGFIVVDEDMYDDMQALCGFGFRLTGRTPDVNASNYKISDVSAAYILQHIESYDLNRHLFNQKLFKKYLKTATLFNYTHNTFYGNIPIVFKNPITPDVFRSLGIEANKYYKPLADHEHANALYDRIINFPLNEDMAEDQIAYICTTIDTYNV
jgi:dTDP-4-amino-4,6-dideoxygalactose transaminase